MDDASVYLCCASPDAVLHSWQLSQQLVCHAAASTFGAVLRWLLPGLQPQPQALQPDSVPPANTTTTLTTIY